MNEQANHNNQGNKNKSYAHIPFLISSHSSISVDSQSKTFKAIPTPKANPTAAAIDQPTARPYCVNIPINEFGSCSIVSPYSISIFPMITFMKSDESVDPSANDIANLESQLAINVLNSPFDAGTNILTSTMDGVYAFSNPISF